MLNIGERAGYWCVIRLLEIVNGAPQPALRRYMIYGYGVKLTNAKVFVYHRRGFKTYTWDVHEKTTGAFLARDEARDTAINIAKVSTEAEGFEVLIGALPLVATYPVIARSDALDFVRDCERREKIDDAMALFPKIGPYNGDPSA